MITLIVAILMTLGVLLYILWVRARDLPEVETPSPFAHLDERKAQIYENLRDLQFEFRVGKLSDEDYQRTKKELQRELAGVMAEIDGVKQTLGTASVPAPKPAASAPPPPKPAGTVCPHCNARFPQKLKFCGECGKAIEEPA